MDFSLNNEQQMLQSTARKFATDILTAEASAVKISVANFLAVDCNICCSLLSEKSIMSDPD